MEKGYEMTGCLFSKGSWDVQEDKTTDSRMVNDGVLSNAACLWTSFVSPSAWYYLHSSSILSRPNHNLSTKEK